MHNDRIKWIDTCKGIAMILVILGHSHLPKILQSFIYSFHMPLFFFLSGYVFNVKNTFKEFSIKKLKTLYIPYLVFSLVIYIFDFTMYFISNKIHKNYNFNFVNRIIGIILPWRGVFSGVLWFLICLVVMEFIMWFIIKASKNNNKIIIAITSIITIIGVIYIKLIGLALPFYIDVVFITFIYFSLGYSLKSSKLLRNIKLNKVSIGIITMILFITYYINYLDLGKTNVELYESKIGNVVLYFLSAFSGIIIFVVISKKFEKSKILNFLGKNTLIYYSLQGVLITILMQGLKLIPYLYKNTFTTDLLRGIIMSIMTLFILIPISKLINKYLPFVIGKNKSKLCD